MVSLIRRMAGTEPDPLYPRVSWQVLIVVRQMHVMNPSRVIRTPASLTLTVTVQMKHGSTQMITFRLRPAIEAGFRGIRTHSEYCKTAESVWLADRVRRPL